MFLSNLVNVNLISVELGQRSTKELLSNKNPTTMSQKLYVGGIPYSSTEDDMKNYFAEAGEVVSATIITDRYTGRSRGFGFVEMSDEEGAKKAIELFDGKEFEGRKLTVNIARPREERNDRQEA